MKHILITLIAALATLVHSQPSNGQIGIPVWTANGTSTVWLTPQNNKVIGVNGSGNLEMVAGGGSSTLGALSDVSLASLTSGQLLQYNGTGWVNWTPTYAPTNSPTFTGTVTIPSGASIAGYLTSATAASTYQHLGYPSLLGSPPGQLNMNAGADNDMTLDLGGVGGSITTSGGNADVAPGGNGGIITTAGNLSFAGGSLIMNSNGANAAGSLNTQSGGNLTMGTGDLAGGGVAGTILTTAGNGSSLTALNASALGSGEIPAARMPALTGDVTTSAGAVATTIANGAVTNAKLAGSIDLTTKVTGSLAVANGGSGVASHTAYAVLTGGATSTGAVQSIASVGTAGQVLTSNGAAALPTFQTVGGSGTVTSVSVVTANGVSGSVATATTTPAITLTLGAITPSTVTASSFIDAANIRCDGSTVFDSSGLRLDIGSIGGFTKVTLGKDDSLVQLGGTSASFSALKRNGTGIDIRLADDSGVGGTFTTGNITLSSGAALQVGNTAVAETPTATHTIIIKDAAGVSYRVLAIPVP